MAPFDKVPVALNCWVVPTAMLWLAGVTAIDASAAVVNTVEPKMLPEVAVMVVEPMARAVTRPESLMAATPVSDELHVTNAVRSWVEPFEKVPVALNCWVVPTAMLGLAGVTAMDTNIGGVTGPAPPSSLTPQLTKERAKTAKNKISQRFLVDTFFFIAPCSNQKLELP